MIPGISDVPFPATLLRSALLLLLLTSLSGCAYLASFSSNLPETIEHQIAAGEYGKALDTLRWIKPDHPHYARLMRLREIARRQAAELEKHTLSETARLEKQGDWHGAEQRYVKALERYPQSEKLRQAHTAFLARRARYLHKLELALLMNRANWLIQNAPIRTEVVRVLPEDYRRYPALRDYDRQVRKTARRLDKCLHEALEEKRAKLLEACLELRLKLDPQHLDKTLIDSARKTLAAYRYRLQRKENDTTRELITELKQGYSHENLLRARRHLDRLSKQPQTDPVSRKLRRELETQFRQGIEQGIAAGRRRYSHGDVAGALAIWQSLAKIDPGNEKLADHIARAERVLEKLERLRRKSAGIAPHGKAGNKQDQGSGGE